MIGKRRDHIHVGYERLPRDFLLKFKPELAQAEAAGIASATNACAAAGQELNLPSVSPRPTEEPGVVGIVIRLKKAADAGTRLR